MPKILEIKKDRGKIYINVEGINTSFMFDLRDIKDKENLKEQIKYSVKCYIKSKTINDNEDTKYTDLKTLEGTDATN